MVLALASLLLHWGKKKQPGLGGGGRGGITKNARDRNRERKRND